MDLKLLDELKEKLGGASNFFPVYEYFLDHFGENPEFISLGDRTDSPFLEAVLAQVGGQLFQKEVEPHGLMLTRLPDQQFIHGACMLRGRLACVIYFEDIQMGLLAVDTAQDGGKLTVARFTGQRVPRGGAPSVN